MDEAVARTRGRAKRGRGLRFAVTELLQVLADWLGGGGDLPGLLVAWWEVVTGRVATGDEEE